VPKRGAGNKKPVRKFSVLHRTGELRKTAIGQGNGKSRGSVADLDTRGPKARGKKGEGFNAGQRGKIKMNEKQCRMGRSNPKRLP